MGMRLKDFVSVLEMARIVGEDEREISGIAYDSRKVVEGDLFVCISGYSTDGHVYAQEAVKRGAVALVVERKLDNVGDVSQVIVDNSRRALALLAAKFFAYPADKFINIGITGTNGKTTTSILVESILRAGGYNPGLIGTISARIGNKEIPVSNTTPESFELHKMFAQMARLGQDSLVMEVSSHALALDRTYKIPYDIAV
ncbi:UDP-N-acetylmuramoyl-L-alanyl-D-glutamate--2,6-diaminopimelate ligase, partial [bacterium]|nr:UDP-N-acetylmuramoyl-L-alanyl-D-glutamate--2,6-diaminopimelate ligase [bacterium]